MWERLEARCKEVLAALNQWAVIAFLAAAVGTHIFFWATCLYLDVQTSTWHADRHPSLTEDVQAACVSQGHPELTCVRLREQVSIADQRGEHHFRGMKSYQTWNFGLLATAYWAGTLAAALLIIIAKQGWDQADEKLKGLFLGLSVSMAFFGGFPALIKAGENSADNKKAYLQYDNLAIEIRSYLLANDRPEVDPAAFVHEVDGKLQELNAIYFDVDASKVDLGRTKLLEATQEAQ